MLKRTKSGYLATITDKKDSQNPTSKNSARKPKILDWKSQQWSPGLLYSHSANSLVNLRFPPKPFISPPTSSSPKEALERSQSQGSFKRRKRQ